MTEHTAYQTAVIWAEEAFNEACAEAEALPVAGSMSEEDIARLAVAAKSEAEERFGVRISATLDGDWNWTFS